jgi:hypothetical protein
MFIARLYTFIKPGLGCVVHNYEAAAAKYALASAGLGCFQNGLQVFLVVCSLPVYEDNVVGLVRPEGGQSVYGVN